MLGKFSPAEIPEAEIPSFEHKEIKRFHSIDFDLNMHLKHLHFLAAAPRATIDRDCPIFKSRQKRRKAGKFIAMTFRLSLHGTTQLIGHPPRWRRSANVVKFLFLVLFPHEENEREKKNCYAKCHPYFFASRIARIFKFTVRNLRFCSDFWSNFGYRLFKLRSDREKGPARTK